MKYAFVTTPLQPFYDAHAMPCWCIEPLILNNCHPAARQLPPFLSHLIVIYPFFFVCHTTSASVSQDQKRGYPSMLTGDGERCAESNS